MSIMNITLGRRGPFPLHPSFLHIIYRLTLLFSYSKLRINIIYVRHCLEWNLLSNPRRIHSEEEDEEKEEWGLPRALICCSTTSPSPPPSPPTHCAPAELPGAALSGHIPPSHSTFTWAKLSDFQEKRLKSMTASF